MPARRDAEFNSAKCRLSKCTNLTWATHALSPLTRIVTELLHRKREYIIDGGTLSGSVQGQRNQTDIEQQLYRRYIITAGRLQNTLLQEHVAFSVATVHCRKPCSVSILFFH